MGIVLAVPMYQLTDSANAEAQRFNNEFAVLEQSTALRQVRVKQARQMEQAITAAEARKQGLLKILDDYQQVSNQRRRAYSALRLPILAAPVGTLPEGAVLHSVSQDSTKLTLHGAAKSYEIALQYADELRRTDGFSNVQVHSLAKANDGELVTFDISLEWS